jgi:Na+-driven multidrug efflux pump/anti-sigma regulatory factor (Ser/Thr protein kinase)
MYERQAKLIGKKFWQFLPPLLFTSAAYALTPIADNIIIGNFLGSDALTASGLCFPLVIFLGALPIFFMYGGAIAAAIAKGEREWRKADAIFVFSVLGSALALGMSAGLTVYFLHPLSYYLAQGDLHLANLVRQYLLPMALAGMPQAVALTLAQFASLEGRPRFAAAVPLVANITNILFAYIFIRHFGLGLQGAGLASIVGYLLGLCLALYYLFFAKWRTFRFVLPTRGEWSLVPSIVATGAAEALDEMMQFLSLLVMNGILLFALGPVGVETMVVCSNFLLLTQVFVSGTSDTMLPLLGVFFGEKDYFGIRAVSKTAFTAIAVFSVLLTLLALIYPEWIGALFGLRNDSMAFFVPALRLFALGLTFNGINYVTKNFYAATGRVALGSVIVVLNGFVLLVLFAFLLAHVAPSLIWLYFPAATGTALLLTIFWGLYTQKKEGVQGFLLLRRDESGQHVWDTTIAASVEAATGLSQAVIEFCLCHGVSTNLANRVGVAVEEMAANIARYGGSRGKGSIDILVRLTAEELILRIRDDGKLFNPLSYRPEETEFAIGGIEVVKRLSGSMDYDTNLGFNTTVITFAR